MTYLNFKKAFHNPSIDEEELYSRRFNAEEAIHLDIQISGNPAFFLMSQDVYEAALRVLKSDKELLCLIRDLPPKAIHQFAMKNLIDEIVITNEIEGVNSTRREVHDILKNLKKNDKRKRFHGLVNKYVMLTESDDIPLDTPQDIRKVYDELVLDEIMSDDKKNVPDGEIFRKDSVSVYAPTQEKIHEGLMPESAIIAALTKSLNFLNSDDCLNLARIAAFHFMFGYIHPFYDGNGRINRYISSHYLAKYFEPIIGYGLSFMIKKRLDEYYKGFALCEGKPAKGDITPFVIMFSDIVAEAAERIVVLLSEGRDDLKKYETAAMHIKEITTSKNLFVFVSILIQATLFSDYGVTITELANTMQTSRQTPYRYLKELEKIDLVKKKKIGKEVFHTIKFERLMELSNL